MGRSGSTVAKFIKLEETPKIVKHTFQEVVRETHNAIEKSGGIS